MWICGKHARVTCGGSCGGNLEIRDAGYTGDDEINEAECDHSVSSTIRGGQQVSCAHPFAIKIAPYEALLLCEVFVRFFFGGFNKLGGS